MDQLSRVLARFSVSAGVFYSGKLCGLSSFEDPNDTKGHIHFLRSGRLRVLEKNQETKILTGPALLFYPRATPHRITAEESDNTEIVCASVDFSSGTASPIANSLPSAICLPLKDCDRIGTAVEWLFEEAFAENNARQIMMDRLCELLIVQLLRHVMSSGQINSGMLAGLAHPQLSRAIDAIHSSPEKSWSLPELADIAVMSRSRFADLFRNVLEQTPGDYLAGWRVELAKGLLKKGQPVGWGCQ